MDGQAVFDAIPTAINSTSAPVHHIISGSFRSFSLFLLAFSPLQRTISLVQHVPAFGPHQYLTANERGDRVYATSWAIPPELSSWSVEKGDEGKLRVEHINSVPITATSSYISLPPPYTHLYSAGGPTGEIHQVDPSTGGFGTKSQEILFVPESDLEKADKTRVALRYGSHAVEISSKGHAFIPVLGTNSIRMYTVNRASGHLNLVSDTQSPRKNDGPRHVIVSPDGKFLYSVTEHTSFVDVYSIKETELDYLQSVSILPRGTDTHNYRGDTLRFHPPTPAHPSPSQLFATTRGTNSSFRGYLTAFDIGPDGLLTEAVERWETPTSGGKANAIELIAKDVEEEGAWIALTDDEPGAGGLWVLDWDGKKVDVVASWIGDKEEGVDMEGGSHAIWLD